MRAGKAQNFSQIMDQQQAWLDFTCMFDAIDSYGQGLCHGVPRDAVTSRVAPLKIPKIA
jgi:hypothetical protein